MPTFVLIVTGWQRSHCKIPLQVWKQPEESAEADEGRGQPYQEEKA